VNRQSAIGNRQSAKRQKGKKAKRQKGKKAKRQKGKEFPAAQDNY
jgi:hypothetical protein